MAINITKSDVRWSYLSLFLSNGINILLLPGILAYLTSAEVGLWYTFTAVYGLVSILDFGFMTTLSRNVTFVWDGADSINSSGFTQPSKGGTPNYKLFIKLFKTTRAFYFFLGLIIFVFLMTGGSLYIHSISNGQLPWDMVIVSWLLYAVSIFLNMIFAYWNPILKGIGAIKQNQQILVFTKVTQLVLTFVALLTGAGLIGVSAAYLISVIVNRLLANKMFYDYEDNQERIKPLLKDKIDRKEYKDIVMKLLPNTYKQALISISNYINLRSTSLISSAFLGLTVTASLGFVLQVVSIIAAIANTFFNTFLPKFSSYRVNHKYTLLEITFKKAILINNLIMIISFIIIIVAGDFILNLLHSNIELLSWPYLLVVMLYMFLYNNHSIYATFIGTKNELPHYRAFIISSVVILTLQLSLMYILTPNIWSLIIPILIVQLLYNNWKWPYEVLREFKQIT
ncbi:hypothetical protein OEA_22510 [Priestia megaterium NCT-2]|uniref:O-unit flippase-like protein n=1 Tax=Priestia megaterium TaxID=1404 RepID=UPI00034AC3DC|nr:O-unit flippase-like protein [Priestia megaterium]AYE52407.1 hypothetical protein OEA_22510 [Priestia megaterium NCT-2]